MPTPDTLPTIRRTLELLSDRDRRLSYFHDPIAWAQDRLGATIWSNPKAPERSQAAIMQSVADNKDTAVKAAHGLSKSWTAAALIVWWLDTRYPRAFVATTAPSTAQISGVVWREVRRMLKAMRERYDQGLIDYAPPPGRITADSVWKDDDGTILGWGRKPPEQDLDSAFQGIHDLYVLAIGDEAAGLSNDMVDALGNITSNATSRRVLICNPTNPASYIGHLFKAQPDNWNFISMSVFDSPNFTGEPVPEELAMALSDQTYVDAKKAEYGENSSRYKSRVLGEFAFDSEDTLISDEDLAVAFDVDIQPSGEQPVLGVDVARYGTDLSVIYSNDRGRIRLVDSWERASGVETANRIHRAALDALAQEVRIDGIGVGGPIVDMVANLSKGRYRVVELRGSAASPDRRQWHNWRAWSYDAVRYALRRGEIDLDFSDTKLVDELGGIRYSFPGTGGMLLESKEDMRRRGLKSPDFADAFIYAAITDEMVEASTGVDTPERLVPLNEVMMSGDNERLWDYV